MSLISQLVEEVKDLVTIKPKWKRFSEQYPEPKGYIYAWHKHDEVIFFLRPFRNYGNLSDVGWETTDVSCEFTKENMLNIFSFWKEAIDADVPPDS